MVQPLQGVDGWRTAKQAMADLLGRIETKQEEVNSATDVCDDFFHTPKNRARKQRDNERYQLHKNANKFMGGGSVLSVAKLASEVLHFSELPPKECPGCLGEFYIIRSGEGGGVADWSLSVEPFVAKMDSAPANYKAIFEAFGTALGEKEVAIAAKMSESENKALRGLRNVFSTIL